MLSTILRYMGAVLIALGALAAAILPARSLGLAVEAPVVTSWTVFPLCFMGGAALFYTLDSPDRSLHQMYEVSAAILLRLGASAAGRILLGAVGPVPTRGEGNLWILFLVCTPARIKPIPDAARKQGQL